MDREALAGRGLAIASAVVYPRLVRRLRDRGVSCPVAAEKLWDFLVDQLLRSVRDCEEAEAFVPFLMRNFGAALPKTLRWHYARRGGEEVPVEALPGREPDPAEVAQRRDAARYVRKWARPGEIDLLMTTPTEASRRTGLAIPHLWRKRNAAAERLRGHALRGGLD